MYVYVWKVWKIDISVRRGGAAHNSQKKISLPNDRQAHHFTVIKMSFFEWFFYAAKKNNSVTMKLTLKTKNLTCSDKINVEHQINSIYISTAYHIEMFLNCS